MRRGGGRSGLTLPLPRSTPPPPSDKWGGGCYGALRSPTPVIGMSSPAEDRPRHNRGGEGPSAVRQASKSSASGSGGWVKNSANGSIPSADLPARLVSQNGEAGGDKQTYLLRHVYPCTTPSPPTMGHKGAVVHIRSNAVSGPSMFADEALVSLLPLRTTSFTSNLGNSPAVRPQARPHHLLSVGPW